MTDQTEPPRLTVAQRAPEYDPARLRQRLENAHTENARLSGQIGDLKRELADLREVSRGYCPECGRGDAAPTVEDWEQQRQRAEQLAATLREVLAAYDATGCLSPAKYQEWNAVLDQPEATP